MPKLVCVDCEVEYKIEKNGVIVAEMFQRNQQVYKLWDADMWKCPKCGKKIIGGFAKGPFAEHYSHNISQILAEAEKAGKTIIFDREVIPST